MPAANTVHIDRLATEIAVAYRNELSEYIADLICPPVKVPKKSNSYAKWPMSTFFRRPTKRAGGIKRAPGTPFVRRDYEVDTESYKTEQFGVEHALDDSTRNNADEAFRVEQIPLEILTEDVIREKEIRVMSMLTNTSNLTRNVTLSGTDQWDDVGSDIVDHFEDAFESVKDRCGKLANLIMIPRKVWRYAKHHPDLLDRVKSKDRYAPSISPANLEEIFVGSCAPNTRVLIPSASYDNAMEGQADALESIWPNDVIVAYVDPSPAMGKPSLCYAPEFLPLSVVRYREEKVTSDIFRVLEDRDEHLVEPNAAFLIKSAT